MNLPRYNPNDPNHQNVVSIRDPRVALENKPLMTIEQGARHYDSRRTPCDNFTTTSLQFNNLAVNSGNLIDRKMYLEYNYSPQLGIKHDGQPGIIYGSNTPGYVGKANNTNDVVIATRPFTGATSSTVIPNGEYGHDPVTNPTYSQFIPPMSVADRIADSLNGIIQMIGIKGGRRTVGPRALGLMQSCTNLTIEINGMPIACSPSTYINAVEWYGNHGWKDHEDYSKCASYPDLFKTYREAGESRTNPLAKFGGQLTREPRGSFWNLKKDFIDSPITPGIFATATNGFYYCIDGFAFRVTSRLSNGLTYIDQVRFVDFLDERIMVASGANAQIPGEAVITMIEPLISPALTPGERNSRAFYGIGTLNVFLQMKNIDNWFCADAYDVPGQTLGDLPHDVTVKVSGRFQQNDAYLHYTVMQPKLLPELPLTNVYGCNNITMKPDRISINTSGRFEFQSGNITSGTIPNRIYVWIGPDQDTKEYGDTDSFCRIDRFDFKYTTSGGQYGQNSSEQLFEFGREAGLNMTLPQWRDHVGSVLCLDFTKNVNLGEGEYAGMVGNFQMNFTGTATTLVDKKNKNYNLYVAVVEEGYITLNNQTAEKTKGTANISPITVPVDYRPSSEMNPNIYGGLSFDSVKRTATKAAKGIASATEKSLPYIKKAIPYVEKALTMAAPLLLAGSLEEEDIYDWCDQYDQAKVKRMINKELKAAGMVGGGVVGGRKTNPAQMRKRLNSAIYGVD